VVTGPLIALAIPSVIIGALFVEPMLFAGFFGDAIQVKPEHDVLAPLGANFHGIMGFILHGMMAPPFWLAMAGVGTAYYFYMMRPDIPEAIKQRFSGIHALLENKYGFDSFNEIFFAGGSRGIGGLLWKFGDTKLIDGLMVNGSAYGVGKIAAVIRHLQSGYLYHYAFAMIIGLLTMLAWVLYR